MSERIALIDADVLRHELGWASHFKDEETGQDKVRSVEWLSELLHTKIKIIKEECYADEVKLFLTDSQDLTDSYNKSNRLFGRNRVFKPNFRNEVAKTRPYKGNRKNPKPYHFDNLTHMMLWNYSTVLSENGLEADDEICIDNTILRKEGCEPIICSRDKDLRIAEGEHYSWECGEKQKALGPTLTDRLGFFIKEEGQPNAKGKVKTKIIGYGLKFFYLQLLMGDAVDNIPGLPGWGEVKAYNLLKDIQSEKELFETVSDLYMSTLTKERNPRNDPFEGQPLQPDEVRKYWREQADLLWIVQELGENNKNGKYQPPR